MLSFYCFTKHGKVLESNFWYKNIFFKIIKTKVQKNFSSMKILRKLLKVKTLKWNLSKQIAFAMMLNYNMVSLTFISIKLKYLKEMRSL